MTEFLDLSRGEMMEHLPPQSKAPILQKLARLGFHRFQDAYAIETPIDPKTGMVDHLELVRQVSDMVDPSHQWQAPFFDEHHLYWYAHRYMSAFHRSPKLAEEFRDMLPNKLWVPRQFHNMIHAVTLPPDVPSHEQMWVQVRRFRRENFVYRLASEVMQLQHRIEVSERKESPKTGQVWFIDEKRRAVPSLEIYEEKRAELIELLEKYHSQSLLDLSSLTTLDLVQEGAIESILPEVKMTFETGLARSKGKLVGREVILPLQRAA